jgi:LysR family transcriptional regulator, benzoate and cis,cis-muconate-responsive activator of ben and cat genes
MELRQLRYFTTVAHELNFTRAAAKLHVAQPALSRQIKQLEEELGVTLLERDKRKVSLTASGETFLTEARSILAQADQALSHMRSGRGKALNIGYVWGLFHSTAPAALHRLRASEPSLALNLFDMTASQQSSALAAGRLDFGFIGTALEAESAALEKRQIGRCEFAIVLPERHPCARRGAVNLAALASELFLVISDDHFPGASRVMHQACEVAGFRPRVLQTAERGHTLLGLVAAGCGVAILPETLRALPHAAVLFRRPVQPIAADLFLAWRRGLEQTLIDRFLAAIPE